jgi:hypothetical protein
VSRCALCALFCAAVSVHGASLRLLRQIDVSAYVHQTFEMEGQPIRGLSFSADDTLLAVVYAERGGPGAPTRLLVVPVEKGQSAVRFSGPAAAPSAQEDDARVAWPQSNDAVAVGSAIPFIQRLAERARCDLEGTVPGQKLLGGFVANDRVVVAEGIRSGTFSSGETSRLVVYDLHCEPQFYQDLGGRVASIDADPSSGRIAIAFTGGNLELVDGATGKTIGSWPDRRAQQVRLLGRGTIICSAFEPAKTPEEPQCWPVDSQSAPRNVPDVRGGAPIAASAGANLAAFTDNTYSFDSFFQAENRGVKRILVWDAASVEKIASWKPERRECGFEVLSKCFKPVPFALSPSGRYLAEGGLGRIRISEIRR